MTIDQAITAVQSLAATSAGVLAVGFGVFYAMVHPRKWLGEQELVKSRTTIARIALEIGMAAQDAARLQAGEVELTKQGWISDLVKDWVDRKKPADWEPSPEELEADPELKGFCSVLSDLASASHESRWLMSIVGQLACDIRNSFLCVAISEIALLLVLGFSVALGELAALGVLIASVVCIVCYFATAYFAWPIVSREQADGEDYKRFSSAMDQEFEAAKTRLFRDTDEDDQESPND